MIEGLSMLEKKLEFFFALKTAKESLVRLLVCGGWINSFQQFQVINTLKTAMFVEGSSN